ncbi:MAG TPA: hypothetical protein VGO52_25980 [Hyphomonadaceae bacterium]|jgi:hypothetical protein|nr:hypothetical protein [Hyphomonadaceae bacterium]
MTMRTLLAVALLVFSATLAEACSQAQRPKFKITELALCDSFEPAKKPDMAYCGPIDSKFLDYVKANLRSDTKQFVITSVGGQGEDAIAASELLSKAGVTLRFRDVCLSACAHFLFLPARHAIVEPNTIVAFHHTSSSLQSLSRALPPQAVAKWSAHMDELAQQERKFFDQSNVDANWLFEPTRRMSMKCIHAQVLEGDTGLPIFGTISSYEYWIPPLAMVQGSRTLEGYWPITGDKEHDDKEVLALATRKELLPLKLSVGYGGSATFHPDRYQQLTMLPLC